MDATSSVKLGQVSSSQQNAAYALFLHCAELRRRRTQFVRVSETKIQLTNQLIAELKQRMSTCSLEDLQILNREKEFKRDLQRKLRNRHRQLKVLAQMKLQVKS